MNPRIIAALAALALVMPAAAQQGPYYDEQAGAWSNAAPPPPPAEYGGDAQPNVDVSVDLAAPGASVSFSTFHDGLAPYGEWITVGSYGRVWRPVRVAAGWRPYYYGRWEWTDEGWLWVSDEPWGWAAYHYGRWANDPSYGWVWIPGYQWAPAWVTWRYSPEYIGWAPLGPGFSVYVTTYPVHYGWWTFVPCHRFVGVPIHSVAFTGARVRGIYGVTQPAPPRAAVFGARAPAWGGPARPFIEQRVGRPITPVRVQPVASPSMAGIGRAGVVPIYRPEARLPAGSRGVQPAPTQPGSPARAVAPVRPQGTYAPGAAAVRPPSPAYSVPPGPGYVRSPNAPGASPQVARPSPALQAPGPAPAPVRSPAAAPARSPATMPGPAPGRAPAAAPAPSRPHGNPAPQTFNSSRPSPAAVQPHAGFAQPRGGLAQAHAGFAQPRAAAPRAAVPTHRR